MQFTWRDDKRHLNLRKHGLDFTLAEKVASDPLSVIVFDRVEDHEERWHLVGAVPTGASFKVVVVVHIYPDPDDYNWMHIISLRPADLAERRRYELSHF